MVKKTITYETFDGVEVTEDFYFNLTKTECTEKNVTTPGGYLELLDKIVKSKDHARIYKEFKEIVLDAYGVKSADGKRFIKSRELSEEFTQTLAYDKLMEELCTNEGFAGEFINAILPKPDASPDKPQITVMNTNV